MTHYHLTSLCFFAEGLSSIIHKAKSQSQITGLRVTRAAPSISYLFFADDSLIFTKATIEECNAMLQILQTYEKALGQVINFEKSAILFSPNVRRELKQSLLETCYIVTVAFIEKYLGFPTMIGRAKNEAMQPIKERVWKRIQGWKERLLFKGGKEVLIKAVAQAIPTYTMSCFQIPIGVCKDMEALMCKFWWGSQEHKRKIHWIHWEKMC